MYITSSSILLSNTIIYFFKHFISTCCVAQLAKKHVKVNDSLIIIPHIHTYREENKTKNIHPKVHKYLDS